jgi:tRNA-dihydrouridine synthase B
MRAGWNEQTVNAPLLAKMVEDAGAAAVCVHGRTAAQSYGGRSDWALIEQVAQSVSIPVFGSGDCIEPEEIVERMRPGKVSGVLVGRGLLRNPWILAQASELAGGRAPRIVTGADRAQFLRDYVGLLLDEGMGRAGGFRVIQRLRALIAWFSKGLEGGSHLRTAVNAAETVPQALQIIDRFFVAEETIRRN